MNLKTLTCTVLLLVPSFVFAARPFVTDDARLTTEGSCQIESWMRLYPNSKELWALPACNPTGNLEFTFGGGREGSQGEQATDDYVFQMKTLFRPLETNSWGVGFAVGTIRHPEINPGPNMLGNTYAYIPLSISLNDDKAIVHANLGWLKDKASDRNSASWGVGGEFKLQTKLLGIAETYGDSLGMSYGQLGLRYTVIPDLFQVDTSFGQQLSGSSTSHWVSIGFRYTPQKLF